MGICTQKESKRNNIIKDNSEVFSYFQINKIKEHLKSICKIVKDNSMCTGFLCLIENRKLNLDVKAFPNIPETKDIFEVKDKILKISKEI